MRHPAGMGAPVQRGLRVGRQTVGRVGPALRRRTRLPRIAASGGGGTSPLRPVWAEYSAVSTVGPVPSLPGSQTQFRWVSSTDSRRLAEVDVSQRAR